MNLYLNKSIEFPIDYIQPFIWLSPKNQPHIFTSAFMKREGLHGIQLVCDK